MKLKEERRETTYLPQKLERALIKQVMNIINFRIFTFLLSCPPFSNPGSASTQNPTMTPAIQRLLETIQKGHSLIEKGQKLIRIADCSEHGRGMVEEYTADDLAVDSDDKLQIDKVERAADRKAAKGCKNAQLSWHLLCRPLGGQTRYATRGVAAALATSIH